MVTVMFFAEIIATIKDYKWHSEDKVLEFFLNGILSEGGPSGSDPYPDWTAAEKAADLLGGVILDDEPEPEYEEGVIY